MNIHAFITKTTGPPPLWVNIDGEAETGKSHLIAVLSATLRNIAIFNGKPSLLV